MHRAHDVIAFVQAVEIVEIVWSVRIVQLAGLVEFVRSAHSSQHLVSGRQMRTSASGPLELRITDNLTAAAGYSQPCSYRTFRR